MNDNDARISFYTITQDDPIVLNVNKGNIEININDKYLDNKTLRAVHFCETRDEHVIENFWKEYKTKLSNNSILRVKIEFAHDDPVEFTNIIAVKYQDILFTRSESVFPKRLMLSVNVYGEEA